MGRSPAHDPRQRTYGTELAERLDDEIAGLRDELEAEVDRYHAIQRASAVARDPDMLLN